jgi:hypothetical protein
MFVKMCSWYYNKSLRNVEDHLSIHFSLCFHDIISRSFKWFCVLIGQNLKEKKTTLKDKIFPKHFPTQYHIECLKMETLKSMCCLCDKDVEFGVYKKVLVWWNKSPRLKLQTIDMKWWLWWILEKQIDCKGNNVNKCNIQQQRGSMTRSYTPCVHSLTIATCRRKYHNTNLKSFHV